MSENPLEVIRRINFQLECLLKLRESITLSGNLGSVTSFISSIDEMEKLCAQALKDGR